MGGGHSKEKGNSEKNGLIFPFTIERFQRSGKSILCQAPEDFTSKKIKLRIPFISRSTFKKVSFPEVIKLKNGLNSGHC